MLYELFHEEIARIQYEISIRRQEITEGVPDEKVFRALRMLREDEYSLEEIAGNCDIPLEMLKELYVLTFNDVTRIIDVISEWDHLHREEIERHKYEIYRRRQKITEGVPDEKVSRALSMLSEGKYSLSKISKYCDIPLIMMIALDDLRVDDASIIINALSSLDYLLRGEIARIRYEMSIRRQEITEGIPNEKVFRALRMLREDEYSFEEIAGNCDIPLEIVKELYALKFNDVSSIIDVISDWRYTFREEIARKEYKNYIRHKEITEYSGIPVDI